MRNWKKNHYNINNTLNIIQLAPFLGTSIILVIAYIYLILEKLYMHSMIYYDYFF